MEEKNRSRISKTGQVKIIISRSAIIGTAPLPGEKARNHWQTVVQERCPKETPWKTPIRFAPTQKEML
jgi:hypothetical protein